jgi:hypothetical protein
VRVTTESKLGAVLGRLPGAPRVVMSGNFATPWRALSILDSAVAEYHLFALNAQPGVPDRTEWSSSQRLSASACGAVRGCGISHAACRWCRTC